MNTVLGLIILMSYNDLNKDINYTISRFIIDHLSEIKDMSINELSKRCFVSTSSINKYCKTLGFKQYSAFKKNLETSIETRLNQMIVRYQEMDQQHWYQLLNPFYNQDELSYLNNNLDMIIEKINKYHSIDIVGAVFPNMLTQSFIEDMAIMNVPVKVINITYNDNELDESELLFLMSLSGRFMNTYPQRYQHIKAKAKELVMISLDKHYPDSILPLSSTLPGETTDILLLVIFNIIKIKYFSKYYHVS